MAENTSGRKENMGLLCSIYMLCVTISTESFELPVMSDEVLYDSYILEICEDYGVDPFLVKALVQHESQYDPVAKNGSCVGLMQVSTVWHKDRAERLGVTDWLDPYSNILLGTEYLSELFADYDDLELVVMLYAEKRSTAFRFHEIGKVSNAASEILYIYYTLKGGG